MRRENTDDHGAEDAEMRSKESLRRKVWRILNKPHYIFPSQDENNVIRLHGYLKELEEELDRVKRERDDLRIEIKEIASKYARLEVERQSLSAQNSDLRKQILNFEDKVKIAGYLEKAAPSLLDWIQSMIGYAENKALFPSDADELAQFRADAKRLPALLRLNKIECNNTPPDEGIGFVHRRDARIGEGIEVLAGPMLLREGVVIADGIVLVPDVSEHPQKFSDIESEQGHTEVRHNERLNTPLDVQPPKASVDAPQAPTIVNGEQLRGLDTEKENTGQSQDVITASGSTNPVDAQMSKDENHSILDSAQLPVCVSDSAGNDGVDTSFLAITPALVDVPSQTDTSDRKSTLELTAEGEQCQNVSNDRAAEFSTYGQDSEITSPVSNGDSEEKHAGVGQQSPWEFDV